ncbi:MAG TPA: maleylpyruvate isomerase N-terminal domain-containing protein [Actinomycetota bacterium]|jgi:hypothetical protein|nr:maleylpyruvate isomerase N-terminal domain-containing protein [Actinomycetota bacterium]
MEPRDALVREEEEGWAELRAQVDLLDAAQLQEPGLNEDGWSVNDLLWHLGCWWAEAATQLERVRLGTYEEHDVPEDDMNARFLEEGRRQDPSEVLALLLAARSRARQELAALDELAPAAHEWFEESGSLHYREHLGDLRRWVSRVGGS